MSTELKPVMLTTGKVMMTQYCGPRREDGGDRRCLQLTPQKMTPYVQMTREDARKVALALLEWTEDEREEA